MKKSWRQPILEVLDVSLTMGGPGNAAPDSYCTNNQNHETHDGQSNKSCNKSAESDPVFGS
ncbi:paeninodin family lasso peptide [Alkalihalobacillus sp. MEB130]|uniref:paeninodin family lasso peptide n=1 Tax=Alkalihalobacillus sp. MEB130 TaxID=2976704 RepID=UPI0037C0F7A0